MGRITTVGFELGCPRLVPGAAPARPRVVVLSGPRVTGRCSVIATGRRPTHREDACSPPGWPSAPPGQSFIRPRPVKMRFVVGGGRSRPNPL